VAQKAVRERTFVKAGLGLLLGYARVSKGDEQSNKVQPIAVPGARLDHACAEQST
jgi:hypothetical protein